MAGACLKIINNISKVREEITAFLLLCKFFCSYMLLLSFSFLPSSYHFLFFLFPATFLSWQGWNLRNKPEVAGVLGAGDEIVAVM